MYNVVVTCSITTRIVACSITIHIVTCSITIHIVTCSITIHIIACSITIRCITHIVEKSKKSGDKRLNCETPVVDEEDINAMDRTPAYIKVTITVLYLYFTSIIIIYFLKMMTKLKLIKL